MKLLVVNPLLRLTILGAWEHSWTYEVSDDLCAFARVVLADLSRFLVHSRL